MEDEKIPSETISIATLTSEITNTNLGSNNQVEQSSEGTQTSMPWYLSDTNTHALSIATYLSLVISILGFLITFISIRTVKKHIMLVKYRHKFDFAKEEINNIMAPFTKKKVPGIQINPDIQESIIGQLKEMRKFSSRKQQERLDEEIKDIRQMKYITDLRTCINSILTDFSYKEDRE